MSCVGSLLEVEMPKGNLASMSVDALLKLRDDIEKVFGRKANELKHQLSRLGDEIGSSKLGRRSSLKDRKLAVKYRDKSGNVWAGRGKTADLAAGEVESRCKAPNGWPRPNLHPTGRNDTIKRLQTLCGPIACVGPP
jgi:hypothetical protein